MEILGGLLAGLVLMALLAGVGLAAIVALAMMGVLWFLTEMDFKKVFLISSGIGLLAPILLGVAISSAIADGSFERDIRSELGDIVQLPEDGGENWREALRDLRDLSEQRDRGVLTDEQAERRVEEILSGVEDLQITIDVDGDGVVIGESDSGVPIELPEPVEASADEEPSS
jgi:hypothetical protein